MPSHSPGAAISSIASDDPSGAAAAAATGPTELAAAPPAPTSRLLSGDIASTVLWLAFPVLGEQLLNAFVAWNDMFLAGRIDKVATAAVGFASYVDWLVSMLFALVGTGATAIVARAIGAGDAVAARRCSNQAIVLAFALGVIAAVTARGGAHYATSAFATSPSVQQTAARFVSITALGYALEAVTFCGAACLRGAGDTRTPMFVLALVNLFNAAASWTLAFALGWGSDGIAWGTVVARCSGGAILLAILSRGRSGLVLVPRLLRPDPALITRITRIGGPAALDGLLMWGGHLAFVVLVTNAGGGFSGDTLLAAHMVGIRIESLSFLPATAWGMAAATLVGQNLGARQLDRARRCANTAVRHTVLLLSGTGLLYLTAAPFLFRILTHDPGVIACGTPALRALGLVQPALAVLIIYIWSLRGAGDTRFPMIFTLVGMICLRIPIAYFAGVVLQGGLIGAWCGMYADLFVRSGLMAWRFHTNRWAGIRV